MSIHKLETNMLKEKSLKNRTIQKQKSKNMNGWKSSNPKKFCVFKFLEHLLAVSNSSIDLKAINTSTNAVSFEPYQYYMCTV